LVATRRLVALATPPLFLEYEDVLKRSEHRLAHGLTLEAIEEFLAEFAALIEPVEVHFQWRPQSRDPNDEMVLEAAINGGADALVTFNVADFAGPAERFRHKHHAKHPNPTPRGAPFYIRLRYVV
jgi:putative PIN family toxin of toxin-antitoxin system